jgi:aspartate/methionine/tyrosine aminotransferase
LRPAGAQATADHDGEAHAEDFFSAPNYSGWVRGSIRATAVHPKPAILYGSSIQEPTDELVRLVREAFSQNLTSRYISVFSDGNRYVADAICARYGVKPETVITTTGVTGALQLTLRSLAGPGDHILIEQPGFDLLSSIARETGAEVEPLPRRAPHFRLDPADLSARLTNRTRAVVITNLHNPTGAYLTAQDVRAAADAANTVGAVLVVDEVYADFTRPEHSMPAAMLAPNIVSVNSLTKVFGLHALKCGWLIAQPPLLARIQNDASEGDVGISKLAHAVAAHVLESADIFDTRWREILARNRPVLRRHSDAMIADGLIEGDLPEYGCMYFPRVRGIGDTAALARALWRRHGILVAPGEYFAMPGHVRIGFGGDAAELDDGLERLHRALMEMRAS